MGRLCCVGIVAAGFFLLAACAITRPEGDVTSQSGVEGYPAVIEATAARRQSGNIAWRLFLAEHGARQVEADLHPILRTPMSLPAALAGKVTVATPSAELTEDTAREALRSFIESQMKLLSGGERTAAPALKDLSLVKFAVESSGFSATYRQMNFGYPIAGDIGRLEIAIKKTGEVLKLRSSLIPRLELPRKPRIETTKLVEGLLQREFTYSAIDGRPLTYKVRGVDEVLVKDLVIYAKEENDRMLLYLAYPVEVGRGTTWTVFFDAISGNELAVAQNFVT